MLKNYTQNEFNRSFAKNYKDLGEDKPLHSLTYNQLTAIFLMSGKTLIYSHNENAFIFTYTIPIELHGAIYNYGHGFKPEEIKLQKNNSNCNLEKNGLIYFSKPKQQFFYSESETFCEYNGRFFKEINGDIHIRRMDQVGLKASILQGDSYKILLWLQKK